MPPTVEPCGVTRVDGDVDMIRVRELVRSNCRALGFGLVDETKLVTAASELTRNIIRYSRPVGGEVRVERLTEGIRKGLRATFEDRGPGIPDVELAMAAGFSTGGSLGLGLPGTKRLVDEFNIVSRLGEGTRIVIVKWRR